MQLYPITTTFDHAKCQCYRLSLWKMQLYDCVQPSAHLIAQSVQSVQSATVTASVRAKCKCMRYPCQDVCSCQVQLPATVSTSVHAKCQCYHISNSVKWSDHTPSVSATIRLARYKIFLTHATYIYDPKNTVGSWKSISFLYRFDMVLIWNHVMAFYGLLGQYGIMLCFF